MDADQFLAWAERCEGRYELVDGQIVAMSGAQRRHDRVVVNCIISLGNQLAGKPCQPGTADLGVKINARKVRRPDALIDCGDTPDESLFAHGPAFVLEVLSPSTRQTDIVRKVAEYQSVPTMRYILLLEPAEPAGVLYAREAEAAPWTLFELDGLDAVAEMPTLSCRLALADLYRGLQSA